MIDRQQGFMLPCHLENEFGNATTRKSTRMRSFTENIPDIYRADGIINGAAGRKMSWLRGMKRRTWNMVSEQRTEPQNLDDRI